MLMAKARYGKGRARYLEFLIDSGADYTLISKSNAYLLGLNYSEINKREVKVEVANLAFISTKKVSLKLTIEGEEINVPALIANQEVENLLGRKGVFDKYDITFKEREQRVIFKKAA